jgi:hypothetical protein
MVCVGDSRNGLCSIDANVDDEDSNTSSMLSPSLLSVDDAISNALNGKLALVAPSTTAIDIAATLSVVMSNAADTEMFRVRYGILKSKAVMTNGALVTVTPALVVVVTG